MSSKFWFLMASFVIGTAAEDKGKSFSIFNVVTFKNGACVANAANDLKGTCYTKEGKIISCLSRAMVSVGAAGVAAPTDF